MILKDQITLLNTLTDDVIAASDAALWLNQGKNKMATEVKCKFPDITVTSDLSEKFAFPDRYHETPVYYAAKIYKEQDSSLSEAQHYLAQFADGLLEFSQNYRPPARYWDKDTVQQFTATDGQTVFTITKDSYSYKYGNLRIYQNDIRLDSSAFTINSDNTFTLTTGTVSGDAVTAEWDEVPETLDPPFLYPGW